MRIRTNTITLGALTSVIALVSGACGRSDQASRSDPASEDAKQLDSAAQCDDPDRSYVSRDPDACAAISFLCGDSEPFFDECGCGCSKTHGNVTCGSNTCGVGEFCCNPSCGICAPLDGVCTQQACESTCSPESCGPQPGIPNHDCPDGVTVAGPTGVCLEIEGGCTWEIIECPDAREEDGCSL
jgi:hypothetical protein